MRQDNLVNDIPITKDKFEHVSCIVEIPKGTNTKYEYNEELNIITDIYGIRIPNIEKYSNGCCLTDLKDK